MKGKTKRIQDTAVRIVLEQWLALERLRLTLETQTAKLEKQLTRLEAALLGAIQGGPVHKETAASALLVIQQMLTDEDRRPRDRYILRDLSALIQRRSGLYDPDFEKGGE